MRAPDHASETEALTPASHPNLGAGLLTPHPTLSRRHLYAHLGSDRCATPLVPAACTLHPSEGAPLRRAPRPPARRREAAPPPRQSPLQSHVPSQRSAPDAGLQRGRPGPPRPAVAMPLPSPGVPQPRGPSLPPPGLPGTQHSPEVEVGSRGQVKGMSSATRDHS